MISEIKSPLRIHTSPEEAESQISQAVHVGNKFVIGQPFPKCYGHKLKYYFKPQVAAMKYL